MNSYFWTRDFPLNTETLKGFGLPVSTQMPLEIYNLMALYPQPGQRRAPRYNLFPCRQGTRRVQEVRENSFQGAALARPNELASISSGDPLAARLPHLPWRDQSFAVRQQRMLGFCAQVQCTFWTSLPSERHLISSTCSSSSSPKVYTQSSTTTRFRNSRSEPFPKQVRPLPSVRTL